jgi:NADH:quinone reductase (non-electrogenic)
MKTRVVILGGGFGGLYTALEMERTIARDPNVEVTLINHDNFFLFTPMLHEVAASDLDMTHIVNPIRKLLRHVRFVQADVERIDLHEKRVDVSHGREQHHHEIEYDQLIIGLGNITNFYGLPGLAEHALTMKSLGDAIFLRNRLIQNIEEADFECVTDQRSALMTIVVAGGGFAGVETIAGVNDFIREAIRFYPNIREDDLRVVLVHAGPVILPELNEKLGRYAEDKLRMRGVDIRLETRVLSYRNNIVELSDGSRIPANTLVWTAGTAPHPLLDTIACRKDRGRIAASELMEVPGWPGVWTLGDCASVPDPSGKPYPPTAQHALRQGRVLARNVAATIRGGEKRPFVFTTLGQLAAIGKRAGVAQIFGFKFSGFVAWWLWRTIYLSKLPRFEKKCRVALDWTLDLLFSKDLVQFTTVRADAMTRAERFAEKIPS